jgi:hypothetical protein
MKTNEIPDSNYLIYTFMTIENYIEKIGLIIPDIRRVQNTDKKLRENSSLIIQNVNR